MQLRIILINGFLMDQHFSSYPEERFSSLLFAEKLLLWSVRLWVDALNRGCGVSELLRDAYRLAGAGDAYLELDGLMTIVATSAISSMDVRCMKCTTVSLDEQAFIRAVAIYQAGFPLFDASEIFTPWLPPAARRLVKPHIAKLSRKFQHSGLRLSCEAGPRPQLRVDAGVIAPGPVTA